MNSKYLADFQYLYEALRKHPLLCREDRFPAFDELYTRLQQTVQDTVSLIHAMTELTMFFEDGHTNIEIPYTGQDLFIKIACEWQGNRLVLKEAYEDMEAGTEVIALEGMRMEQILELAAKVIPHENKYLVKSRMIEYPYQNYHMFSEMNLTKWFGQKTAYEVIFRKGNKEFVRQCKLVYYDGFIDFQEDDFTHYEIQGTKAVLHVDGCIYDEEYKSALESLAKLCKERNVEILELDLSKNMGGASAVIDEFIQYVDVDSFRRYEMIDYSAETPTVVTSRADVISNCKKDILFPKKIVCRVSNTTFSSARTFAATLKDNNIARIIGEPTGGKPCSSGMPKRDKTPNCNIKFRVSRCLFLRPNADGEDDMALFPEQS